MSYTRKRINKPDASTVKIVDELRALGFTVIYDDTVDLDVTHKKWGPNIWKKLECKSRKKKNGDVVLDKRQEEQAEFCAEHGVPYVTNTFEALLALGEKVSL